MPVSVASTKKSVRLALLQILNATGYKPKPGLPLFLKPNLAAAIDTRSSRRLSEKILTSQALMSAICEIFPGRQIILGEGSAIGFSAEEVFRILRLERLREKYGLTLLDLNHASRRRVPWDFGTLELPEVAFTSEYWNLPKAKTHIQTLVTLGFKNQKGLLQSGKKLHFHKHGLDKHIAALSRAIRPYYTVVDGIHSMEGNGPSVGRVLSTRWLLGGSDAGEVDRAACRLMGIDPAEVLHLGAGPVQWIGCDPKPFQRKFKHPQMPFSLRLGRIRVDWFDSCTGCALALKASLDYMLADKRYWPALFKFGLFKGLRIVMGHAPEKIPDLAVSWFFGDCACKKACGPERTLPGCPPDPKALLELLTQKSKKNNQRLI